MKRIYILALLGLYMQAAYAQPVTGFDRRGNDVHSRFFPQGRITSSEICDNNIDDDNNLLTDENDFGCRFNPSTPFYCKPTSVIWGCSADEGLYWADLASGAEHHIKKIRLFVDLAWGSNGKLYGCAGNIWEIDPATGDISAERSLPENYLAGNAMTSDRDGNLYIVADKLNLPATTHLIKLNLATWQICFIADLTIRRVGSDGDLTFLNGDLYLSCNGGQIAKVNVETGHFELRASINNPSSSNAFYGLTAMGDGYFYVSDKNNIYRLDPASMMVDQTPVFTFANSSVHLLGTASYMELCHAPKCAKLIIQPSDTPPYCSNAPPMLTASAGTTCYEESGKFTWTTPSGNVVPGNKVTAEDAGMYYVQYRPSSDTCSPIDSFLVEYDDCEVSVFIPTAFTPNDDGLNDVLKPEVKGNASRLLNYEFSIYNRWGQLIFKTQDMSRGWNGTIGGQKQATETFVWTCRYQVKGLQSTVRRGTLILLR